MAISKWQEVVSSGGGLPFLSALDQKSEIEIERNTGSCVWEEDMLIAESRVVDIVREKSGTCNSITTRLAMFSAAGCRPE